VQLTSVADSAWAGARLVARQMELETTHVAPAMATEMALPTLHHAALAAFAVSSIPRAFITASVVLSVGLPFSLNDR
jgi:hypothetical protein